MHMGQTHMGDTLQWQVPAIYSTHIRKFIYKPQCKRVCLSWCDCDTALLSETHTGNGILHQYCPNNTVEAGHVQLDIGVK